MDLSSLNNVIKQSQKPLSYEYVIITDLPKRYIFALRFDSVML